MTAAAALVASWATALMIWALVSLPLAIFVGKFIKTGRGPEGDEPCSDYDGEV